MLRGDRVQHALPQYRYALRLGRRGRGVRTAEEEEEAQGPYRVADVDRAVDVRVSPAEGVVLGDND